MYQDHHSEDHDQNAPLWDHKTAKWYAAEYGDHISNAMTIHHAGLKTEDHLLDIGCGTGTACREAAKIIIKGTITGIDPIPVMIRIANEQTSNNIKQIHFLEGSTEEIPLPSSSMTICTAINSLHHWSDYKKGFEEILRVLMPGGRLIISDEIVVNDSCGHGDGSLSDPDKVTKEIENAGFSNVSLEKHEVNGEGIYLFRAENS